MSMLAQFKPASHAAYLHDRSNTCIVQEARLSNVAPLTDALQRLYFMQRCFARCCLLKAGSTLALGLESKSVLHPLDELCIC